MAIKNYQSRIWSLDRDSVMLHGRCTIGAAGAISGLAGSGFQAITKESGTGKFSFTLQDTYNRLLNASIRVVAQSIVTAATSLTGKVEVQSVVFPAKAAATSGDHFILTDAAGSPWGISLDLTGSAPEPTGALWAAIPAAQKAHVDISGGTDAPSVAALVETAFDLLVAVPWTTATTSATIAFTNTIRANIAASAVYNSAESAAGSMTTSTGTAGVDSSVEFAVANTFTVVAHGFSTGRKIQTSISGGGTLPSGITTTTDYYVIKVDANNFKLAASLANAEAGTAITITDQGTADKTITYTPFNPFGSGVANVEITDVTPDAEIQAKGKVTFTCYDYAGAAINPMDDSLIFINVLVRNSSIKGKGE